MGIGIKEAGLMIRCMEKESFIGMMKVNIQVNINKIQFKAMESLHQMMEANILDFGKTECNMEKVSLFQETM